MENERQPKPKMAGISPETHEVLREMAHKQHTTIRALIDKAVTRLTERWKAVKP